MIAIDIYFFLNLGFDFLLLQTVALLMHRRRKPLLLLAGAVVGALWSCVSFLFGNHYPILDKLITYFLCPLVMYAVINGRERLSLREIITGVCCFYFAACMGSGLMNLFYRLFSGSAVKSGPALIAVMAGMQLLLLFFVRLQKRESERKTLFCRTVLLLRKRKWETVGIWDTGNRLRSATGKPVHMIDQIGLRAFLGEEAVLQVRNIQEGKTRDGEDSLKLQPVFCSGIGKEADIIFAFEADEMIIWQNGRKIIKENVLIGVSKTLFCNGKNYQLILNTGDE